MFLHFKMIRKKITILKLIIKFLRGKILDVIATYPIDSSTLNIESLMMVPIDFELNFENSVFLVCRWYFEIEGKKLNKQFFI